MERHAQGPQEERDGIGPLPIRQQYQPGSLYTTHSEPPSPASARLRHARRQDSISSDSSDPHASSEWTRGADGILRPLARAATFDTSSRPRCGADCPLLRHANRLNHPERPLRYQIRRPPSRSDADINIGRVYHSLHHSATRLIKLLPDHNEAPLVCELVTAFSSDDGLRAPSAISPTVEYDALSYSWGKAELDAGIICNGSLLAISANLSDALVYLRQPKQPRHLWVDGLCINQSDPLEKAAQVRNMLRFFEKAHRVIAWIGEPKYTNIQTNGPTEFSLNETRWLFSALTNERLVSAMRNDDFGLMGPHHKECNDIAQDVYKLLISHCERPWFFRTWVRQEVFAANGVILRCGQESFDLDRFFQQLFALAGVWQKSQSLGFGPLRQVDQEEVVKLMPPETCSILRDDLYHGGNNRRQGDQISGTYTVSRRRYTAHFMSTLQTVPEFDVTDPRDRVYAVLGMIRSTSHRPFIDDRNDVREAEFPIDYRKTEGQVFGDVIQYLINVDQNLDALTVFEDRTNRATDLPSYAVDWRDDLARSFITTPLARVPEKEIFLHTERQNQKTHALRLIGRSLGMIQSLERNTLTRQQHNLIWPPLPASTDPERHVRLSVLQQSYVQGTATFPLSSTPDSPSSSISSTSTSNFPSGPSPPPRKYLVPTAAQIFDHVVALQGGQTAFLLRPLRRRHRHPLPHPGENVYTFVGPVAFLTDQREMRTWKAREADGGVSYIVPTVLTWDQVRREELVTFVII